MLATLDPETQREWELNTASRTDIPSTTELMTFLELRCKALELLQLTQTLKMSTSTPRSSHPMGNKVSKPTYTHVATKLQCALCKDSHRLFKCDKFHKMEVKQQLNCQTVKIVLQLLATICQEPHMFKTSVLSL